MRKEDEEFARRVWAGTKIETCRSYLKAEDLFRKMSRTEYVKYVKPALFDMATRSAKEAITQWGGDVKTITHIVFGTMTGSIHAPTMDTQIALELGLQTNIKRLNIEGMGCLTGYRCLGLASDIARADPSNIVLTCVVDIRSALGNQLSKHEDFSPIDKSNVIVSSLFRDSGASAIVTAAPSLFSPTSNKVSPTKPSSLPLYDILEHRSMLIPDSIHLARYAEHDDAVIHLFLDKQLPNAVASVLKQEIDAMITPFGLSTNDCSYSVHTGGPKVLTNVQDALKVTPERLASSWYCMKKYGNLSGSSNLVVLDHWRKLSLLDPTIKQDAREYMVCISFGPGVGMELVLLRAIDVPFTR
jgi:alkylresorcinol/alkylpyrone synthase